MSGKLPGGLPTILLIDVPASRSGQTRFRAYLDRECVYDLTIGLDTLEVIAERIHKAWIDTHPRYVILDAPIEVEQFLRDILRHRGMRILVQPR